MLERGASWAQSASARSAFSWRASPGAERSLDFSDGPFIMNAWASPSRRDIAPALWLPVGLRVHRERGPVYLRERRRAIVGAPADPLRDGDPAVVPASSSDSPGRLVQERVLPVFDELAPEVFFGGQGIVCRTAQGEIRRAVIAALGKRFQVVKLQALRLGTTRSVRVNVTTAVTVALEDGAADGGGNVTHAPALRDPRILCGHCGNECMLALVHRCDCE
jgi:hypothetical protein